jgi:hypothetical protein
VNDRFRPHESSVEQLSVEDAAVHERHRQLCKVGSQTGVQVVDRHHVAGTVAY